MGSLSQSSSRSGRPRSLYPYPWRNKRLTENEGRPLPLLTTMALKIGRVNLPTDTKKAARRPRLGSAHNKQTTTCRRWQQQQACKNMNRCLAFDVRRLKQAPQLGISPRIIIKNRVDINYIHHCFGDPR
jgi:hypothetical protein